MADPTTTDVLSFPRLERTLPNGLRVVVVNTGFPNLVSLQIPVQTGSRNEIEPGKSGFAHFFEHMMFRGTKRFSPDAYQAMIARTGARQNAYTTDDYTNFHITCSVEDLETILDLEADRFMNLEYPEPDFRTEARAILGEYNKSASDPLTKLIEVQRDHAYTTHTYKHTTMGFLRDIEAMPEQFAYSRTFFERWYRPENASVIVAGTLDLEVTVALVEKHFGAWKPGPRETVAIPAEPEQSAPAVAHVDWPAPTLPWVTIGFHGPAFSDTDPDYAALDVLMDLFFGETSELYQRLVEREQKVDQLFPYLPASKDRGLASIFARVKDPVDQAYVRDVIIEAIAAARGGSQDPGRLEDAKSNMRYSFARTLDNSESVAATLARFVHFERSAETINTLFRTSAKLTTDDLHRVANSYFNERRMIVTTLGQGPQPAEMAAPPSIAAAEGDAAPALVPAAQIVLPSASSLLRIKLMFTVGSSQDPSGQEGLAALAAEMIASAGSRRMRTEEITRALFPIAGGFSARVDREMTTFTGVIHRDNLDRFLSIVLPQLLEPGFREEDFTRLHEQQRNQLIEDLRANNDEELAKERLQAIAYAGTGYGHPALGTVSGIDGTTLDDVRGFVAGQYTRGNLTVGLTGALPEGFADRLQQLLATLPSGATPALNIPGATLPRGIEVEIVQKETRSVAISLGHPIPVTRSHPHFAALWVARSWLGEHRASNGRLFQRIRELRGMNYGDYAYIEAFPNGMYQFFPDTNLGRRAQLFEIWIRPVPPEHAVFALKLALHELDHLVTEGLSTEDFDATRDFLMKNVFLATKTQDQQLGFALDSAWYEMGDFVTEMRASLSRLSVSDVNAAIRLHLSAADLHVVMVARDAERLRDQLLSTAPAVMTYDAEKPEDLLAEDRLVGARDLGLREESVRIMPAESVFA